MNLLYTAHVPAGDGPFPTVVALHGWGASAHDLLGLAPVFPSGTLVLCPQGTVAFEVGPGMAGHGWFPLVSGQPVDPESFRRASTELRTFVEEAPDHLPIDREKTVVLGFSQGGVMGFDLTLRTPESFAGLVALSTWLPEPLAADFPQLETQRDFPILMLHGLKDSMVSLERARKSKDVLKAMGVGLDFQEFDMAHEIRPESLKAVLSWLEGRFGG